MRTSLAPLLVLLAALPGRAQPRALPLPPIAPKARPLRPSPDDEPRDPTRSPRIAPALSPRPEAPRDTRHNPPETPRSGERVVVRRALANGLRVIVAPDRSAESVTIAAVYDAGGRREPRGREGVAELVARLAEDDSRSASRSGDTRGLLARAGAPDASVTRDRSAFVHVVPLRAVELALALEAERMSARNEDLADSLARHDAAHDKIRPSAVEPWSAAARARLEALVYRGFFPYEHGLPSAPPRSLRTGWIRQFRAQRYAPAGAVLAIAGPVDPSDALARIERRFGGIAAGVAAPADDEAAALPAQTAPRFAAVVDGRAARAVVLVGWAISPRGEGDVDALTVAAHVLGASPSSRLARKLARDDGGVAEVKVDVEDRFGPGLFRVEARLATGADAERAGRVVGDTLDELARVGPTASELDEAREVIARSRRARLEAPSTRALALAEVELARGDATLAERDVERPLSVTAAAVRAAVARFLTKERSSCVVAWPYSDAGSPGR